MERRRIRSFSLPEKLETGGKEKKERGIQWATSKMCSVGEWECQVLGLKCRFGAKEKRKKVGVSSFRIQKGSKK